MQNVPTKVEGFDNSNIQVPYISSYLTMNGGEGPSSYAQHSSTQKAIFDYAKETIKEIISAELDVMKLASSSTNGMFCIADFGCGTGPNSPHAIGVFIEAILGQKESQGGPLPLDVLVFFNDIFATDFHTLFASLPPERNYFASILPGSFGQRLLPKSSLHLGYSSMAVHWLTEIPKELTDRKSPAWNNGAIFCSMSDENRVHTAYLDQFTKDIQTFLEARAEEMVCGGMMVLIIPVATFTNIPSYVHFLTLSLMDLVNKGRITQDQVDSFNLPYYFPTVEELKAVMNKCSGSFSIKKLETISTAKQQTYAVPLSNLTGSIRSVNEFVLQNHFGKEVMDELFEIFKGLLATRNTADDESSMTAMVILKRNKNN